MTTASIARQEQISEKMLERIAAKLKHKGFVRSVRGIGGGYELARPANAITVTEILRTMETPYLPLHCSDASEVCPAGDPDCAIFHMLTRVDQAIVSVTDSVTVADLIRK